MKILHLSAAGKASGAGSAALSIQQMLRKQGVDAKILFLTGEENQDLGILSYAIGFLQRAKRFFYTALDRSLTKFYPKRKPEIFSPGLFGPDISNHPDVLSADLIHLHWVNHGFVAISELEKINKPIVWTMHDMWVFTGGCHYSFSCQKYEETCGACPVLNSTNEKDLSQKIILKKISSLPLDKITFVSISSWMSTLANRSKLLKGRADNVIFSGINTDYFNLKAGGDARKVLGLPVNRKIILLGANDLLNPAKGLAYALKALAKISPDVLIVTFGNTALKATDVVQEVVNFGFVSDKNIMANLYAAADLFLATSVAEAFGMTLAEAQCCGTPVVAFDYGGPKDIVKHKNTGYLAKYPDVEDLVEGIGFLFENVLNRKNISDHGAENFSLNKSVAKYIEIYQDRIGIMQNKI